MRRFASLTAAWLTIASGIAFWPIACGSATAVSSGTAPDGGPDGTLAEGGRQDGGGGASDAPDALPPDAGTVSVQRDAGTPISPFAFGHNYWDWVDWSQNGTTGISGTEPLVAAMHLNVIRAGGANNDTNSPQPFDATQIDKFVAYCRAVGAEPVLQVPILGNPTDGGATSPQVAADMVTYANVTQGYGIRYWEIGNEPDGYSTLSNVNPGVPMTPADYCTTYQAYASAMTAANAAAADGGVPMHFVGPDLAWKYIPGNDWLTPFLDACKDVVDVVSIHRYPFSAAMVSADAVLADGAKFGLALANVKAIVAGHARPGTPLAVMEANVSYDYDPTKYTDAAAAAGPGSFLSALWVADSVGVALQNQVWSLAFWNIGEVDLTGSVLGFIVGGSPVPPYYGQELISSHFRGDLVVPTGVPVGYSVYASHDAAGAVTSIAVINKTSTAGSLTFALDGVPGRALGFPALSLSLVQVPDDPSGAVHLWRYTADVAAPVQVQ
jgi:hypothetical protein